VFNFFAIQYLPLAETLSITFSAPLMVTALSGPLLGEWPGPRRWAATAVGFVGVLIIIQPQPATFQPAMLLSIGAAVTYAGYYLTTRMLSASDTAGGMLIYGSLFGAVLMTPALPAFAEVPPTWLVAAALVTTGLAGGLGHLVLIHAAACAPATVLTPFTYTQIVWMVASGYFIFGDVPRSSTLIGVTFVIAAGLYILYRERVHRDR
jgi:drug/metabolite transporter (DMT)-like permease